MKRAHILIAGILAATLVLAAARGGGDEEEQPTPQPATQAPAATATTAPAATATAAPAATATSVPAPTATAAPAPTATTAPEPTVDPATAHAAGAALEIGVTGMNLEFDTDNLTVSAGSEVVLTFNNGSDAFQHNWVLVKDGTKDDVALRGTGAGPTNDWVQPGDADVVAHTKLVNPGETGDVTFTAPAAGVYQYACTFPGHNITMFGTLEVSN